MIDERHSCDDDIRAHLTLSPYPTQIHTTHPTSTPHIYTRLDDIRAHLLVSPWPTTNIHKHACCRACCSCAGSIKLCCMWTGLFCFAVDSSAGLFDRFDLFDRSLTDLTTYLPVKAPVKLTHLTICARWKSSIRRLHKRQRQWRMKDNEWWKTLKDERQWRKKDIRRLHNRQKSLESCVSLDRP